MRRAWRRRRRRLSALRVRSTTLSTRLPDTARSMPGTAAVRLETYRMRFRLAPLAAAVALLIQALSAAPAHAEAAAPPQRSEEHTSELQSRENLVCRLLLEKKK